MADRRISAAVDVISSAAAVGWQAWDEAQVGVWLASVHLGAFQDRFRDLHCSGRLLPKIGNAVLLDEYGIASDLDRTRILAEIDALVGRNTHPSAWCGASGTLTAADLPCMRWDTTAVVAWLDGNFVKPNIIATFKSLHISGKVLPGITELHLATELGVVEYIDRLRLMADLDAVADRDSDVPPGV